MPTAASAPRPHTLPRDATARVQRAYAVSSLTTLAEIEEFAPQWREFERRSTRALFFQSCDWSLMACRVFAAQRGSAFEPLVLTVHHGGELLAIAPFRIAQRGLARIAIDISDPFGQFGDLVIADGANVDAIVGEIMAGLHAVPDLDGLHMRRVRADSAVREAILHHGGFAASAPDAAPYVDLRPYAGFDDYLKTINAKSRKNLRNLRNRLSRVAPVSHRVYSGAEIREAIRQSFDGRLRWLDDHGVPSTAFADPAFRPFIEAVGERAAHGELPLLAMGLHCGDVPVSLQWGFVQGGRYYAYIAARNPDYDAYSPGRLHMQDVIQSCYERGIAVCDFLAPAASYKLTWTDTATEVVDVAVPFSLTGRLWLDLWNRRLRSAIKQRYAQLPLGLRRILRRVVG